MRSLFRVHLTLLIALGLLMACSDSSNNTAINVTVAEPPAPATFALRGVAAVGAALDGATIEVIDAAGNLVDIGDSATGSDGSYSVTLPANTALPVVIRATPPGGTPLLSIVQPPAEGSTEIVANINPVTNLVSGSILGASNTSSEADIAGALATVDPATINASGDAVINKVFGSGVDYDAFATDPDFVAADGTNSGSAADAVLDTIANRANEAGTTVEDALMLFADAEEPPALLEDPGFQVELVGELVKGGTAAEELENSLTSIGALQTPADGETDVFRTIIQVVPMVIENTRASTAAASDNQNLANAAIDATVKVISSTVTKKVQRFKADANSVNSLLMSPSFQATTNKVVTTAITPIIAAADASGDADTLLNTVSSVTRSIAEEASEVVSGFDFGENSTDVSDLVSGFVSSVVTRTPITTETLQGISSGSVSASEVVSDSGDVSSIQTQIISFANDNPDLVDGDVTTTIQSIPTGTWDQSDWGDFNWG